jgi:hypothetical protein
MRFKKPRSQYTQLEETRTPYMANNCCIVPNFLPFRVEDGNSVVSHIPSLIQAIAAHGDKHCKCIMH